MSPEEPDLTNPVSESWKQLLEQTSLSVSPWGVSPLPLAKLGAKGVWELTQAIQEFSRSTRRLSWVNLGLTAVIAVATAVYAWVAYVTYGNR